MSGTLADTRNSLVMRLANQQDVEAWDQFVEIYQPLVFRLARSKGFQEADAHDIVQEVMIAVSKAIHRWEPDPSKGRFRDWLFRIARNLMINFMTRRKHRSLSQGGVKGIDMAEFLDEQPDRTSCVSDVSNEFDLEYRRELFLIASERIRREVRQNTWEAFRMTALDQIPMHEAASQLQMTVGAVLVARCRVMARMRECVKSLIDQA
ncbi:MAG: sigma-70 family RNA polymerase sigma factor [Pirellula sp.]